MFDKNLKLHQYQQVNTELCLWFIEKDDKHIFLLNSTPLYQSQAYRWYVNIYQISPPFKMQETEFELYTEAEDWLRKHGYLESI